MNSDESRLTTAEVLAKIPPRWKSENLLEALLKHDRLSPEEQEMFCKARGVIRYEWSSLSLTFTCNKSGSMDDSRSIH